MIELLVDEVRFTQGHMETGIPVRAKRANGSRGSYDIVVLQRDSLIAWLKSRPDCAEQVVLLLLGYE